MTCPACGKDVLEIDVKCGSCGAALGASGAHRLLGTMMLGQYELVDVLGQGGMSVVFKGRHNLTNQEVALKILPPELAAHSQVKSRFLEEAKALASLDHPNIVHLYNFGQENGYFVLAMQFVSGQTWERMILEAGRLDWTVSCRIAIDVLRALEYAHGRGVVHRDMKPSNVLVRSRDSVATVMDFGIAKMTNSTRLTATGQTMGTVRYMSPEQVRGQEVDLRTDIYSLGATLYESLVGDTPFDGSTHFEIMTKHLSDAPQRPGKRGVTLPDAVEDAVMRSLAKRAEDRFGSAREMRKQLEAALRDADLGLVETQKLGREDLAGSRPPAPSGTPTAPLGGNRLASPAAAALADVLEPEPEPATANASARPRPRRRRLLWIALALAVVVGGGASAVLVMQRTARYHSVVEIAGVQLTKGKTVDKLLVETDGAIEPDELAAMYASTLGALRNYVESQLADARLAIGDPVDVLLAVPAGALCEPTAYLDRQAPRDCAAALSAIAIGARGTHRLMVVSDRAQLIPALRRGVAQAACEFSPVEDTRRVREFCDATSRFAGASN
ncbi:MAG TPA: serine/threonine-protein kinase [Kofleriaceae bacterium]|nr:serine/threonine-protein kinase [Kofleriaceae bacterium]